MLRELGQIFAKWGRNRDPLPPELAAELQPTLTTLMDILEHGDARVRAVASDQVAWLHDRAACALPWLLELAERPDPSDDVLKALSQVGRCAGAEARASFRGRALSLCRGRLDRAWIASIYGIFEPDVAELPALVRSPSSAERMTAAEVLSQSAGRCSSAEAGAVAEALMGLMADRNKDVVREAVLRAGTSASTSGGTWSAS